MNVVKGMDEYMKRGHSSEKHGCHGYGPYRILWDGD